MTLVTGIAALFLGYSMVYTGIVNLLNGGQGPTLFEAMGFTGKLNSPATKTVGNTGSNQTGQPPVYNVDTPTMNKGPVI